MSVGQQPGERLRIVVADTGRGIAPERLQELFQPFNRLGAERTEVEGHGIGLALAKRLVELMDGAIGVESAVGQGTRFWIEFPELAQPVHAAAAAPDRPERIEEQMVALQGRKLLYIEDGDVNRLLVTMLLKKSAGIELRCAETGGEGLTMVDEFQPHALLLDMQLPDMDGIEVLARLRRSGHALPVIAYSADATAQTSERMLRLGALAYLSKPVDHVKLKQALLLAFAA